MRFIKPLLSKGQKVKNGRTVKEVKGAFTYNLRIVTMKDQVRI